jgi:hypothetical protein
MELLQKMLPGDCFIIGIMLEVEHWLLCLLKQSVQHSQSPLTQICIAFATCKGIAASPSSRQAAIVATPL